MGLRIVVLGAAGRVGRHIVADLLVAGHTVLAQSRDPRRLSNLKQSLPDYDCQLRTVDCALNTDTDVADLQLGVHELIGTPDAAVAALGGWYVGAELSELSTRLWRETLASNLTAHFVGARAVALLLGGADPAYLMLNGIAGAQPCVRSGAISAAGAGQHMLIRVLQAEGLGRRVRFHELSVFADIDTEGSGAPGSVTAAMLTGTVRRILTGDIVAPFISLTVDGVG